MKIKVAVDKCGALPTRAHDDDAGWDLYTPVDLMIPRHGSVTVDTGVHVEIPKGYVGMLKSKSGLNVKKDLISEGVIDAGYTGSIVVKLYNHSENVRHINAQQKITQLVIMPIAQIEGLDWVDSIDADTERGSNGFGSSGE